MEDINNTNLSEHLRFEKSLPSPIREYVFERDRWACRCCNSDLGISAHHIKPKSLGRDHHYSNLVTLCFKCHRAVHDGILIVRNINGNFFFGGREKLWN